MEFIVDNLPSFLSSINITYLEAKKDFKVVCPYHNDKGFGNAVIYKESQLLVCFHGACKAHANMIDLYMHQSGKDFKDAMKDLTGHGYVKDKTAFGAKKRKRLLNKRKQENTSEQEPVKPNIPTPQKNNNIVEDFDPNAFKYTRQRGFTKEFCDEFEIKKCLKGLYKDYFIIPITSKERNIQTFEARKLIEEETLIDVLQVKGNLDFLRGEFVKYAEGRKLALKPNVDKKIRLHEGDIEIDDPTLTYLLKPKTLYPPNALANKPLIWNIDNLNREETLYVVEGLGSVAKIYTQISKNVTSVFGSKLSEMQIEQLNEFTEIVLLTDYDSAGFGLAKTFAERVRARWYVKLIKIKDTHPDYVNEVINNELLGFFTYRQQYHNMIYSLKN